MTPDFPEIEIALPTDEQIIQAARSYAEFSEPRLTIEKAVLTNRDEERYTWFVDIFHKGHPDPYTFIVWVQDGGLTVRFHDV
jgi:hypothetical protein